MSWSNHFSSGNFPSSTFVEREHPRPDNRFKSGAVNFECLFCLNKDKITRKKKFTICLPEKSD